MPIAAYLSLLRGAGAAALLTACGGTDTGNQLAISTTGDGVEYRADWTYRSFDVDVNLTLITREHPDECRTTAVLDVNDVLSAEASYDLAPTDCGVLRMTPDGDIELHGRSTGHDWTNESLSVDADADLIVLGPAAGIDEVTGEAATYRFTLAAPPCPDNPDCDCGALRRSGGPESLALELGRICD